MDLAVDSAGYIYLDGWFPYVHGGYNAVGMYDQAGNYLRYVGGFSGPPLGQIPASVAAGPSGEIVLVSRGERAREFVPTTGFTTQWGAGGSGIGQFDSPSGVAINSAGRIYVADTGNNRIQVFRQSTAVPETTITAGPHGTISDRTPTFRFSSPDLDATFACKLDSAPYKSCRSPRTTLRLPNGKHTFRVRATDPNGTDPTPAVRSFRVKYPM
jgi:DNA-binding beta-propeller fold protein YncE